MKIVSYNINGIRAAIKKGLASWLKKTNPDVICLQEIKAFKEQFDEKVFTNLGYYCYWHSAEKKGYSGVAILSKIKPNKVIFGIGIKKIDIEGRVIKAEFNNINIYSVYFPSGSSSHIRQNYKMKFLDCFMSFIKKEKGPLLISGDYNICHKSIDIHDPIRNQNNSGFLPEERDWVTSFLQLGFLDTFREKNKNPDYYTWWSYRAMSRARNKGWRIDYHMLTKKDAHRIKTSLILKEVKHSDHCPIYIEIK